MRCKNPESIRYAQVAVVVKRVILMLYGGLRLRDTGKVYTRIRTPRFLWERCACVNSGSQAVSSPTGNGLGTRLTEHMPTCIYSVLWEALMPC